MFIAAGMNANRWRTRMANTPVRTFRVDETTWNRIKQEAKLQGTSVSAFVLTVIKNHLDRKGN
jgi:hypothetical protein